MLDLGFPDFFRKAPCATPELRETFFSRRPTDQRVAKKVCASCLFINECEESLDRGDYGTYGVVAGLTPADRRRIKKGK